MNEKGCAFVCAILTTICAVLSWFSTKTGNGDAMVLTFWFGLAVVILCGFVIVCKYVP